MSGGKFTDSLTAVVLTKDESANIGRCLEALFWVPRVLVVDSFSTDETLDIVRSFPNVEVVQREFDSFAGQCNYALSQVDTEWVLSLDADYLVTDELQREVCMLDLSGPAGYRVPFVYCIHGHPLRGTLYPARTVLYRRKAARYEDFGHGHRVKIDGPVRDLAGSLRHDDRKPLTRWLKNQMVYASREADYLTAAQDAELGAIDKMRRAILPAPIAIGFYVLFVKRCVFDGWPGWHYTMQRLLAEVLISLQLVDRKLGGAAKVNED